MAREQHGWYTSEYKMEVVQKYLSDNYKVEPFCKEIGISKSTFYQWLKIYTQQFHNFFQQKEIQMIMEENITLMKKSFVPSYY